MTEPATLPVNEVFATVQGEGTFTGVASVFVRLQGCDVGCPWCDTKHTWERDPRHAVPPVHMLAKQAEPEPTYATMSPDEIVEAVRALAPSVRHVVITGGEPAMHSLHALLDALDNAGMYAQLETSGTYPIPMRSSYWVTLSPKLDMPGGKKVRSTAWLRANEIKLPVGKQADIDRFLAAAEQWLDTFKDKRIYLQPLSQSAKATDLCVQQAIERGWCVSVQTHKYIGVR